MIVRNFFVLCIVCGVFAVLFSNLVNSQREDDGLVRFEEQFRLR